MSVALSLAIFLAPVALGASSYTAAVDMIEAPSASADCVYFTLVGVSQADPVAPGAPWFAVPRAHPGMREIFTILLAAQKTGSTVWVQTTGAAAGGACGSYVGVEFVVSRGT
jgi:hypothetical protein